MASGDFPPGLAEKIAALGPNFNNEVLGATRALYLPLVKQQPAAEITISPDLAYGADPRQKLDLYRPRGAKRPMLVFIPGGGFVGGDKNADGTFYPNLGIYFARYGWLTVIANYRLAPAHPWPAGAQDVASAIGWARTNAASHGGDPNRLFLFGQSAGASHAATYLFNSDFHPAGGPGITAAILMSGVYRVGANPGPNMIAYYGADEGQYQARSAITHAAKSKVPLLLSLAEYDPPGLSIPTFELAAAVTARDGRSPQFIWQQGHNHVSTVLSLGSGQEDVGGRIREFLSGF